ncbi:hypothetical protein CAEBREN_32649 [Caenorhabditis brenneri]|uniref:Phlebovirus glycoprotein G2 fusion domain-containing protein n=1 Tax=Caenorhabditis brenneri TaxID=135651 RepID=G0PM73_CAEBE|nr:hypothetical protein CAEBREN_32649 [Caenorhabditis brenneri]
MLFGNVTGSGASQLPTHAVCTPTGLQIRGYYESFEACVKEYCTSRTRLRWSQIRTADIWIPPHLKTAPHHATVKIFDGHDLSTWELDCAAVHLCDTIDCTFCWSNILNPECHMTYAILGLGMTSFLSLFCIYALCCVPVRLLDIAVLGWSIIKLVGRGIRVLVTRAVNRIRKGTFTRQRNRWSLSMAIICLSMITSGNACQEIDFLSALQTRCTDNNGNQKCETFTDVVVNLNQVKQDGCIRITKNGTHHWDIRLRLEEVVLSCTKESITTTQDVITRVWSTKRCDSAGSCSSGKCANITRDARIPELHTVNNYTGFTGCSESCGGLGCGCFYLSSGCLFYRVYAVPRNPELYEVYRCMDYSTNAVVTMTSTRLQGWQNKDQTKDLILAIGTSVAFSEAVVTLDTLWTPPSPILNNWFITNKNRTATWVPNHVPAYTCSENGQNCSLQDTCHCNPAENAMICSCKNEDLKDWFNQVDRRLPVHQGHWRLEQQNESIVAQMKHGATASLTIRLRDQWKTVKYITEDTCTVTHSPAIGCYSCENGATAEIFCKSEKTETFASIQCDRDAFAVKCNPDGHVSNITFFSEYSRFRKSCTVECGGPQQKIEINGMLKYTASIWTTIDRLVAGNTTLYNEWNLPDIGHIFESYLTMMKTIIIMMISVFAIFFFTYSIIVSTGVKTAKGILKLILMIILFPVTALVYLYFFGRRRLARNRHKTDHIA